MCSYVTEDWELKEALLGFEPINGSHTGWALAGIVENVPEKHNLIKQLLAITADNVSNNKTLCSSLQALLERRGITCKAGTMTVNCLAHLLNLLAKVFRDGLDISPAVETLSTNSIASEDKTLSATTVIDATATVNDTAAVTAGPLYTAEQVVRGIDGKEVARTVIKV
jgi:hypothetical protein